MYFMLYVNNIKNGGKYMIKKYQILKEQINYAITNSGLDIGAAYFIMKDIMNNLEHLYYAQVNKECLEEAEKNEMLDDSKENISKTE